MGKVRVIYRDDGGVDVIHAAPKSKSSEQECLEGATPGGAIYDDVDISEIPQTREKREAWKGSKGNGIHVDEVLATEQKAAKDEAVLIEAEKEDLADKAAKQSLKDKGLIT